MSLYYLAYYFLGINNFFIKNKMWELQQNSTVKSFKLELFPHRKIRIDYGILFQTQ
ncbi:hypothetical protein LEP1GSC059_2305 [Leptospira noguchii serovar Panama str. CZ214]|uniref:Uncharacterized protein n=1 Tax=Leptospira noguchii serovar Panama str. CZ214 TaxID=1001595 RepID=T0FJ75_9LEPT|nr:hypothetical protein LEP1GSC059_2305 [Leptospira noguchii serovar Panama str. CZ214]